MAWPRDAHSPAAARLLAWRACVLKSRGDVPLPPRREGCLRERERLSTTPLPCCTARPRQSHRPEAPLMPSAVGRRLADSSRPRAIDKSSTSTTIPFTIRLHFAAPRCLPSAGAPPPRSSPELAAACRILAESSPRRWADPGVPCVLLSFFPSAARRPKLTRFPARSLAEGPVHALWALAESPLKNLAIVCLFLVSWHIYR